MTNDESPVAVPSGGLVSDLVTPAQAAVYLNVAKNTVYHWIKMGYFPHHRVGKLIRIRLADLRRFLSASRVEERPTLHQAASQSTTMPT